MTWGEVFWLVHQQTNQKGFPLWGRLKYLSVWWDEIILGGEAWGCKLVSVSSSMGRCTLHLYCMSQCECSDPLIPMLQAAPVLAPSRVFMQVCTGVCQDYWITPLLKTRTQKDKSEFMTKRARGFCTEIWPLTPRSEELPFLHGSAFPQSH